LNKEKGGGKNNPIISETMFREGGIGLTSGGGMTTSFTIRSYIEKRPVSKAGWRNGARGPVCTGRKAGAYILTTQRWVSGEA